MNYQIRLCLEDKAWQWSMLNGQTLSYDTKQGVLGGTEDCFPFSWIPSPTDPVLLMLHFGYVNL
jgi:hypothetical protein